MSNYHNILIPLTVDPESQAVGQRAMDIAKQFNATLNSMYVVNPMPISWITYADKAEMQDAMQRVFGGEIQPLDDDEQRDYNTLRRLSSRYGILPQNQHLCMGNIEDEIIKVVNKIQADLVIMGRQQHKGLSVFFKHKFDGIYDEVEADILVIKNHIKPKS